MNRERFRFALKWAAGHFLTSALVVATAAAMVFWVWYPDPWQGMLGVASIFGIVVLVDLVCGPLLTFILSSPKKSKRERWLDLSLIGMIQVGALTYGLWSVFIARPVVLAFEVDRLFVVTANEIQTELLEQAPDGLRSLPWTGVMKVGLRPATSANEYLNSVAQSVEGVSQSMRPNWWRAYDEDVRNAVRMKAVPLAKLVEKNPQQKSEIQRAAERTGRSLGELFYLPLTSSKTTHWVALLDAAGNMVGHAEVDGFH